MLLMIDNYDSFTYNVVQYLAELGADVQVYRNDEITIEQIEACVATPNLQQHHCGTSNTFSCGAKRDRRPIAVCQ